MKATHIDEGAALIARHFRRCCTFVFGILCGLIVAHFCAAQATRESLGFPPRELPGLAQLSYIEKMDHRIEGSDYKQRKIVIPFARASGANAETVTLIDVLAGGGNWVTPDLSHLAVDKMAIPVSLRQQFQDYYDGSGFIGWMPVPKNWRLQRAAIGLDGTTVYTFVAHDGAASGWLSYSVIPACLSCILGDADGLLPGAWEQEVAGDYLHGATPWQPAPRPDRLEHPNNCTALLRYRRDGLTVHAAVLSNQPLGTTAAPALAEVYAALPASGKPMADAIVEGFRATFKACHSGGEWQNR